LLAYTIPAAANQRYLIAGGAFVYQQFVDIIREKFPELRSTTPEGHPNEPLPPIYLLDTSKIKKELGLTFHTVEETVVDTVNSLRALEKKVKT
jgi:nucleoside-diphosphate-sugar epimerase